MIGAVDVPVTDMFVPALTDVTATFKLATSCTVVFLVTPPCTIGKGSVPANAPALVNKLILVSAIIIVF
jgi:hypothetical protein